MTEYFPVHVGKTVVVTGGTQGIGLAVVRRFLNEGANVVAADIVNTTEFPTNVADIATAERAHFVQMDVTDFASVESGIKEVLDLCGTIDVLVCNAGFAKFGDIETVSMDDWQDTLDVILNGAFYCVRAALPALKQSHGNVVSTASISGYGVNYSLNAYFAAKAGLINLTRYMALEYGKSGIRFNAVAPGPIRSHPNEGTVFDNEELLAYYRDVTPLGRLGLVDDLTGVYSFLASDNASWVTGQTVVADGGLTLWTGEYDLGRIQAKLS